MTTNRQAPARRVATPEEMRALTGASFTFSDEQWAAISAPMEPGVVIAGAGSGKTEVMSARVIYLVANGLVRADEVLGLTFTTKATAELAERIRGALARTGLDVVEASGESADDEAPERLEPTVATYNAYAAGLLTEHGLRIGHEPDLRVMADAGRYQLAARAVARHRGEISLFTEHPATAIQSLLTLDSAMAEHLVSSADVRAFQLRERPHFEAALAVAKGKTEIQRVLTKMTERDELLGLVDDYRALKRDLGLIDFSDHIAGACALAEEHPEVGRLEREKFKVVLLDEYQDTSVAQARMLAALFPHHPVTAVGDPNQAIYGWRGASVSNILRFTEHFPIAPGRPGHRRQLTVNRRSDQRILQVANVLAEPLYAATEWVEPLVAKPDAGAGEVRTIVHHTATDEIEWLVGGVKAAHEQFGSWKEIGVLVRTNAHAAEVYDALAAAEVPVEIVGLGGLLRLPEVAEVVATLTLIEDLTANAAVLTLLTGPRWAIGQRDMALLGRRSSQLAGGQARSDQPAGVEDSLREAVAGSDPTEIPSLCDALEDLGDLPYSPQARARFELLAGELRHLRGFAGEPLLDLLRRIIDVTGIDVELASSVSQAAPARRDNLEIFVRAVADFQAIDGAVTLSALLAWLQAEDEFGQGLDVATPGESDSVKLLTVHRAKGLEYDAVFLMGVGNKKFPVETTRSQWTTKADVLPAPLRGDADDVPQLKGYEKADLVTLGQAARDHQAVEELRLGYVAFTRAKHLLWVSSHLWGSTIKPIGPSPYQATTREVMAQWGAQPDLWCEAAEGETNPLREQPADLKWPLTDRTAEAERRVVAAGLVRERQQQAAPLGAVPELGVDEAALVQTWDAELETLLREALADQTAEIVVPLPSSLSATAMTRLRDDPEGFARELARPMPRPPVAAARFGTRFHAWVEDRFGQQELLDPDELPGRGDSEVADDSDLKEVIAAFESGPFAHRAPLRVEPPFALTIAGQVIRGRIDAVYDDPDSGPGHYLVVDWKTNRRHNADPLQLAIYRIAWAELVGVPIERVRSAFYYVRSAELVEPDAFTDRAGLEALLSDRTQQ